MRLCYVFYQTNFKRTFIRFSIIYRLLTSKYVTSFRQPPLYSRHFSGAIFANLLSKKRGAFDHLSPFFSWYHIKWIIGGFFLTRIGAIVFTMLLSGESSQNDQAIQELATAISPTTLFSTYLCASTDWRRNHFPLFYHE